MERLGREMVGKCAGLPLAIVILGGILVTKPSLIEWEKVYNDSRLSLKKGKGLGEDFQRELFDILVWSYNDLPPQLKPCFLYLGKYSENEWIETENLYQLWIAEGMVLSSDKREGETMMQVAESYMGELVHKSMVQVRFNHMEPSLIKFQSCLLHDLIRDLSITQAGVEDFFKVVDFRERNEYCQNTCVDSRFAYTRQLVVYFGEGYTKKQGKYFVNKANPQRYRSMLLFNDFAMRSSPQELGSHVANFRYLRVFAMEKVQFDPQTVSHSLFRINLGRVVGSLVYLRYLSVRGTNLFPSIQKLVLLQTLKLDVQNHIYIPPWLSRNVMNKLGRLRHLYLPVKLDHSLMENLKLRLDSLSKLETLENFNTNWCDVKDLPKLISLQKLSLQVGYSYVDLEEMMKYLTALSSSSCLRHLALSIVIEDLGLQNCPDILRQLLRDHNFNLEKLAIIGRLPELTKLFEQHRQQLCNTPIDVSLVRITRLSLSLSRLEEDPMPVLENIPTLCELFLFIKAFVGKEMVCSASGFLKLSRLVLRDLPNLVNWRMEEGSMPFLSRLKIRECPQLEKLPEGLIFLNSLQVLVLEVMPSDFSDRVQVVNGEQGADFYKVAHVPRLIIDNHLKSHSSSH